MTLQMKSLCLIESRANRSFIYISRGTLFRLIAPTPGIILGAFAAHDHLIPSTTFLPNFVGLIIGSVSACAIYFGKDLIKRSPEIISLVSFVLLLACFLSKGNEGVHRWISAGPFNLNVSMLLTPLILFCLGVSFVSRKLFSIALLIGLLGVHIFQPDAGQATAIGASVISMLALESQLSKKFRLFGIIFSTIGVFFAWKQPDPLLAIDQVERILHLIAGLGFFGVFLMAVSIGVMFFSIAPAISIANFKRNDTWVTGIGLVIYFAAQILVTEFGNFPVPVLGAGISGVIGWYLICGLNAKTSEMAAK